MFKIKRYSAFKNFVSRKEADEYAKEHGLYVDDELTFFGIALCIFIMYYGVKYVAGILL